MPIVISSKGSDFNAWRPAGEFALAYREALLNRTAHLLSDQAEQLLVDTERELEQQAVVHEAALRRLRRLIDQVSGASDPSGLRPLVVEFYGAAYTFFNQNLASLALYRLSQDFFRAMCGMLVNYARQELGLSLAKLPPLALVALGSAGRREFTPFSRLPLAMVCAETAADPAVPLTLFGRIVHEAFQAAGLSPDEVITPRNPDWNGGVDIWRERLSQGGAQSEPARLLALLRLSDQQAVYDEGVGETFRQMCLAQLQTSRTGLSLMTKQISGFSSGVGMMGRLKVERRGEHQGGFNLSAYALLPLSASVSCLTLIRQGQAPDTPGRIRELLQRGAVNVELAERLLEAWHFFNELRLGWEAAVQPEWQRQDLFVDLHHMSEDELERFKECLEAVSTFQRQVAIAFGSWEG